MKKYILIIALVIFSGVLWIFINLFRYEEVISNGFCIKQASFKEKYNIIDCSTNLVIVEDVAGWIVAEKYLYGALRDGGFFSISVGDLKLNKFSSMKSIDVFLKENGMDNYDMNDEENISHMKDYNRKY